MRNLAALLILSASRHILRIRRRRADWRRAFCAQLRAVVECLTVGLAFAPVVGFCLLAGRA